MRSIWLINVACEWNLLVYLAIDFNNLRKVFQKF